MSIKSHVHLGRRAFLRGSAMLPLSTVAASLGGVSLLGMDKAMAAHCPPGPRSLVCIFLAGGADSFNMFVPTDQRYTEYQQTRHDLAVAEADLLEASGSEQGSFAFNKQLPGMLDLYNANKLAVVSNVGPLIRPTTPDDYSVSRSLPENLFAHDAQQRLWQSAASRVSGSTFGWGGGIAEQLAQCNDRAGISAAFSMSGSNAWQSSRNARYVSLNPNARIERMFGLDPSIAAWIPESSRLGTANVLASALDSASGVDQPLMLREAAASILDANTATQQLEAALNNHPLTEWLPNVANTLETQLHLVTRLISAREELNMERQIFFVQLGGWDTHSDQNERLPILLNTLNSAITAYQNTIDSLSLSNSVTSFTASDFGRTLTSNGNGTDHGWGGHNFVFGGAVQGGQVYGEIPSYASSNNPDDAGDNGQFAGRIIPTLSVNQYGATLSRWMGVSENSLSLLFPDLDNFSSQDIGFMG